jgi:tricorn protease
VAEGAILLAINGVSLRDASPAALLRNQAGKPVRLEVRDPDAGATREVIAVPLSLAEEADLRYHDWEYTRRVDVEAQGGGRIGYVHLRAMGAADFEQWAREFYPIWNLPGLIVDLRNNLGGNIESWVLGRLSRKPWMWWQGRAGAPYPNMQTSFPRHAVVLVNEATISDGEVFAEGFRRLGLGPVLGIRSGGAEIWLTYANVLVDRGIASSAEFGVYGPEGAWLIEGHGVDPDIVVDNPPHATFQGEDAQLEAAIRYLNEKIAAEPIVVPPAPPYPVKAAR